MENVAGGNIIETWHEDGTFTREYTEEDAKDHENLLYSPTPATPGSATQADSL